MEKFGLKVFGRGFGGEPFLRKVSPDKSHIYFFTSTAHMGLALYFTELTDMLLNRYGKDA
ncbi:MAG: hypothetical protein IKW96_02375 [Ruminococcus sp.]|uniref:hypothetical protein n=1 Tax=Ruminococcus sp. TaxID=41978 RepID=UPI0025D24CC3|nr:hypothetical protein [Ruminococcus sp.]MBR5682117.1 hypothetical protein [Ruminococcus sp.]